MIVTVTNTAMAMVSEFALNASLSTIAIVILLLLLIKKEILSASRKPHAAAVDKALNIAIAPLLFIFFLIVIAKVIAAVE